MRDLDRLKCIQAIVDGDLKPWARREETRVDLPAGAAARAPVCLSC